MNTATINQKSEVSSQESVAKPKTRRRKATPDFRIYFSESTLRVAVEELQQAVRWRDRSRLPNCSGATRRAARSIMRSHALRSRRAYACELLVAN